ncbi:MAG TPA: alpha/beta hydrolase [Candidatus Saccharimonadales bacterium]|nr:alpha/beta hydrolase [Candidatus Saccharimonadales bacterium]
MSIESFLRVEKSSHIYFEKIEKANSSTAIIFLHGLCGSRRQWHKQYRGLSKKYSLYFIDLLGFGFSAKPNIQYTLSTHVEALHTFIQKEVKEKSIILVGHSFGTIVALGYLQKYPKQVKKTFLLSLPYFLSSEEAMSHLKANYRPQYFVVDSWYLKLTCKVWCHYGGPITRKIMPYIYKNLPKEVAHDGLLHTYNSYITSLYNVVYKQDITSLLTKNISQKIYLFHANNDKLAPFSNIQNLSKKYNLPLHIVKDGTHDLPFEAKNDIFKLLYEFS